MINLIQPVNEAPGTYLSSELGEQQNAYNNNYQYIRHQLTSCLKKEVASRLSEKIWNQSF